MGTIAWAVVCLVFVGGHGWLTQKLWQRCYFTKYNIVMRLGTSLSDSQAWDLLKDLRGDPSKPFCWVSFRARLRRMAQWTLAVLPLLLAWFVAVWVP